jgi:hypothetical protein
MTSPIDELIATLDYLEQATDMHYNLYHLPSWEITEEDYND